MNRREFLEVMGLTASGCCLSAALPPNPAVGETAASPLAAQAFYWSWWAHEPLDHYRRMNTVVGAVDANASGLLQWCERIHSEELVRMMAGLGVNLAEAHFFKGFGLKHEHAEQQRTAREGSDPGLSCQHLAPMVAHRTTRHHGPRRRSAS
jgi:hypothetical protein